MTQQIVIISTCADAVEAERVARLLLEERLAACVSVVPRVRSYYHWEGAIQEGEEYLLLIKTSRGLFDQVKARVEAVHSYQIPELLAVPVEEGSEKYLQWMDLNLRGTGKGD